MFNKGEIVHTLVQRYNGRGQLLEIGTVGTIKGYDGKTYSVKLNGGGIQLFNPPEISDDFSKRKLQESDKRWIKENLTNRGIAF